MNGHTHVLAASAATILNSNPEDNCILFNQRTLSWLDVFPSMYYVARGRHFSDEKENALFNNCLFIVVADYFSAILLCVLLFFFGTLRSTTTLSIYFLFAMASIVYGQCQVSVVNMVFDGHLN